MPKFGCCSQAFVFPQSRVQDLVHLYEEKKLGYVDMLTEEFANANNEIRWAVTPSVMQHVGTKSSKEEPEPEQQPQTKTGPSVADLWNFEFELNDPGALAQEHVEFLGSEDLG